MTFNSVQFAIGLAAVVLIAWRLTHRRQNVFLLVVSYGFYAVWDWRFLALLFISSVIGYTSGIALAAATDERRRRGILISRVALNLGMLAVFKYAAFFVDGLSDLLGVVGLDTTAPTLSIILPIAISYYTFEEISYAVDIYRRKIEPCRDVVAYGLFVAFFPKLVAGPILRPKELIPQIERPRQRPDREGVVAALGLLLWGLVQKVVIADSLAVHVNDIFRDPSTMSWFALTVGTLCFAGQIYGDFSGYTDIARGAARLLGFELPPNFRQPYLSSSFTAFWRTWHMTLSRWLRDYLYVPLGGNRGGVRRTMVNLMIVMLLGGLWHGAGWTFLIWGGIHGAMLALERLSGRAVDNSDEVPVARQVPRILLTFGLVCVAWVFFRAESLDAALEILGRIATLQGGSNALSAVPWLLVATVVLLTADLVRRRRELEGPRSIAVTSDRVGVLVGVAAVALVVTSGGSPVPFVYFQF
jgi:D-alanyl-lipoteichoic acid acyltransferase DltB (MBOAT superfamily)